MLRPLKQLMTSKRSRLAGRGENLRVRPQIERLEDRAMLSATMGPMPYGYGGGGFAPHPGGPRPGEATMIASAPQYSSGHGGQEFRVERGPGPTLGGMHDGPLGMGPAMDRYDPGPPFYDSRVSHEPTSVQLPSNPPPQTTTYVVMIPTGPPVMVGDYWYVPVTYVPVAMLPEPTAKVSSANASSSIVPAPFELAPINLPKALNALRPPGPGGSGPPAGLNVPALRSLTLPSALSGIPSASQIVSREIDSAAMLSTGALDAAFQSYASRLLLVTSASNDHMNMKATDNVSAPVTEAFDGYIGLTDFAIGSDEILPMNPVKQEREAVDAVLRDLQDLETLPSDPMSAVREGDNAIGVTVDTELQLSPFSGPLDGMPVNDSDGGMVMLQASGDANGSDLSFAGDDDKLDLLNVRAGVEASVGFYQAVDVATEDVPAANDLPVASPAVDPAPQSEPDHRFSTEGETGSSQKAAAVVGATTFVGALLWTGQRKRRDDTFDATSNDATHRRRVIAS